MGTLRFTSEDRSDGPVGVSTSRRQLYLALLVTLVVLALGWHGRNVLGGQWQRARGYEFEWTAYPLSQGHGYTMYPDSWLGPYDAPYTPTAWVEPVQTVIMAVVFRALGDEGRLALVMLNFLWFASSCLILFELGRRMVNPAAGFVAAIALAAFGPGKQELHLYVGNSALATALISLTALSLFVSFERPSIKRSAQLGALLGVLALTHSATLLFAPLAATLLIFAGEDKGSRRSLNRSAVLLLAALAIILPWTARNWIAFGEFVLVRTGLGQNMHYALPALAQTVQPDIRLGAAWTPPPWTAGGPRQAVSMINSQDRWRALVNHSLEVGRASAPDHYDQLNEAQRDAILAEQSFAFIWSYPWMTVRLAAAKLYAFFWGNWRAFRVVTLLALVGAAYGARRHRAWLILCLISLYLVPYLLSAPIYYRYRAPIEPLMFLLCSLPAGALAEWMLDRFRKPWLLSLGLIRN